MRADIPFLRASRATRWRVHARRRGGWRSGRRHSGGRQSGRRCSCSHHCARGQMLIGQALAEERALAEAVWRRTEWGGAGASGASERAEAGEDEEPDPCAHQQPRNRAHGARRRGGAKAEIPARRDPARSSGGYVIRTDGRRRRGSRQPARRAPPLRHLHSEPRAQPQLLRAPLSRRDACASCGWRRGSASRTLHVQREHASAQPGPQGPDALTLASPAQAHSW